MQIIMFAYRRLAGFLLYFFLPAIFCVFVWRLRLFLLLFYLQLYRYFDILLQILPTANFTRIYVLIQFAKIP